MIPEAGQNEASVLLHTLADALDACWDSIQILYAKHWQTPFLVSAGIRDDYEIYLLEHGEGTFRVGEEVCKLRRGDLVLLRTDQENAFESDKPFRFMLVTFAIGREHPAKTALDKALAEAGLLRLTPEDTQELLALLYAMQNNLALYSQGNTFEIKVLLGDLVRRLCRTSGRAGEKRGLSGRATADYVEAVVSYLQENYTHSVSLEDLGKWVGLNPRYLCSLYARQTGQTIWVTLRSIRLDAARRLLLSTALSVTEIAMETGFSDSQYFSRVFAAAEGMSPRAYRQAAHKTG